MDSRLLSLLRCPDTGALLRVEDQEERDGLIYSGFLVSEGNGCQYPIREYIPRFISAGNYADSFGLQWNRHSKTQLDSVTGKSISRERLFLATGWPQHMPNMRILEAGAGAGRFTEVLLRTGAEICSFDYTRAVEANAINNGGSRRLHLLQADIYRIPFVGGAFDKVLCLGVLQHTPDPEAAFRSLVRQVKPGGELAIDIYAWRLSSALHWRFILRPITKRMNKAVLYKLVEKLTPLLLPVAVFLRRVAGRAGARLVPIAEHSSLRLPPNLHRQWAILDTFDWFSPTYDKPRTLGTVRRWFDEAGFVDVTVRYGPNGIVGRGRRPA